jgi:L-alanine-DL-glutamate epimerase-like enolase superfamily enzyme
MVDVSLASFDAPLTQGGAEAPDLPGLGVEPDRSRLGVPVAIFGGS